MPGRGRNVWPVVVPASLSGTRAGGSRLAVAELERAVLISAGGSGELDLGCGLAVADAGFGGGVRKAVPGLKGAGFRELVVSTRDASVGTRDDCSSRRIF